MSKRFMTGLVLIGAVIIVLLLNSSGSVTLNLGVTDISMLKSFALFSFLGLGVVIGFLLR